MFSLLCIIYFYFLS